MTISVPNQLVYSSNGDGATSQFSYPVRILEAGELVVIRSEGGVDTPLTLNTDYTLSGIGDAGGVTITMLSVPTAGQEITRYRATAPKQIVDLKDKQTNPAEAVEQQLDRLAMVGQDHNQRISEYEGRIDDLDSSVAAAAASATAAGTSETNAAASATAADADAERAEAAAASAGLPTIVGDTFLRAKSDATGYDALTATELVTALNVKALNGDGGFTFDTTATTQDFMPAGTFGGAWKAAHVLASSDEAIFAGTRSTLAVTREVVGTGGLNPETDYTLFLTAKNTDLTDTTLGELGVLRMLTFGNERGDKGLFIGTVYKHKGDGSSEEGAALAYELGTRIIQNNDLTDIVAHHQILGAFYPNPTGLFGGLGHHGYYSEHYVGVGYAHLSGIDTGSGGTGSMTYGIALHRTRDPDDRYFTVAAGTGNIESITNAAAGVAGPVWTLNNPGANTAGHVAGRIIFQGVNANAVAVAYGQIQGVVGDPTAGSADGYLSLSAVVGNTVTEQLRITDGVDVRTNLKVAGAQRIDASGGIRPKVYTAAEIGDVTHAVNTTDKTAGKSIWDGTNGRILSASSNTATSPWIVGNSTVAITPA